MTPIQILSAIVLFATTWIFGFIYLLFEKKKPRLALIWFIAPFVVGLIFGGQQ